MSTQTASKGGKQTGKTSNNLIPGATGDWEVVIGMEVHAQVASNAKLFSGASTAFGAAPNTHVSLVDAAMPGMLPVINEGCIRQAVKTGLGLKAKINLNLYRTSVDFEREGEHVAVAESLNPRAVELAACGCFQRSGTVAVVVNAVDRRMKTQVYCRASGFLHTVHDCLDPLLGLLSRRSLERAQRSLNLDPFGNHVAQSAAGQLADVGAPADAHEEGHAPDRRETHGTILRTGGNLGEMGAARFDRPGTHGIHHALAQYE